MFLIKFVIASFTPAVLTGLQALVKDGSSVLKICFIYLRLNTLG